jgi:hypothetical protein
MRNKSIDALVWFLGYDIQEMKATPDMSSLPMIYEGVNIKVQTENMLGGWTLGENGPEVVWFVLVRLSNGKVKFQRME